MNRALEVARALSIPSNREVLHVLPRGFIVDGQEGVKDPLGMSAVRLEIETHIVTAGGTAVRNLAKCVQAANVKIDELVANSLASAEAVLNETERDLGVAVADIGAGTIDLALFLDGSPFKTIVIPVGGNNVTNDIAIGLKTTLQVAEELKIQYGSCDLSGISPDEVINVETLGDTSGMQISRLDVCQIIEARMREIFEMLHAEIRAAGEGMLPAGVVLTGGAAQLAGAAALGREVLESARPCRGARRRWRPDGQHHEPGFQHRDRLAVLGRQGPRGGGVRELRVRSRDGSAVPRPGRPPEPLPVGEDMARTPSEPNERFRCRISVLRKDFRADLFEQFPAGYPGACGIQEVGQVFETLSPWYPPEGLCPWAWADMRPVIHRIHAGNDQVKIQSCTDGLRPVTYKLEAVPLDE